MARVREWTDSEVQRLRELYTSTRSFDEITLEFPARTSNAIRLKASRLGIKRPTLETHFINAQKVTLQSLGGDAVKGYLLKCRDCGTWIHADRLATGICQTISCSECGSLYEVLTES
ncbi:hypothetical protein JXL21_00660 [Candidatus Bathyarchaeota archaeon]|nr:hypothetical protein [Candidatus Bathyarchaeota archaeon]